MPVPSVCKRQQAFTTKTRTIILFANMTLNRLGFGGTPTRHFHFRNNETEDMLVHNRQQKLWLSVRTKSDTHFVKTSPRFLNASNTDFEL